MEEINLVTESMKFVFLGMGIIFVFLIVILFSLKKQNEILKNFSSQEKVEPQTINVVVEADVTNTETAKIAAVIAAVQHHKNLKG